MKIAIVGAGIVGCAIAHALLDEGHEVLILDKEGARLRALARQRRLDGPYRHPADRQPQDPRQVPKFLLDPLGPLAIRPAYFPKLSALAAALRAGGAAGRL